MPRIIQLEHPRYRPWVTDLSQNRAPKRAEFAHERLPLAGMGYVDGKLRRISWFGEWESAAYTSKHPDGTHGAFLPYFEELRDYTDFHSTDPWIFDNLFRACACRLHEHAEMSKLSLGDMIIYGSVPHTVDADQRWIFDTVFVVGDRFPITGVSGKLPTQLHRDHMWLQASLYPPMSGEIVPRMWTVYTGLSEDLSPDLYSWIPASLDTFPPVPQPRVNSTPDWTPDHKCRSLSGHEHWETVDDSVVAQVWQMLRDQAQEAGYIPVSHIQAPEFR